MKLIAHNTLHTIAEKKQITVNAIMALIHGAYQEDGSMYQTVRESLLKKLSLAQLDCLWCLIISKSGNGQPIKEDDE